MNIRLLVFALPLLFLGCTEPDSDTANAVRIEIPGRDRGVASEGRPLVYRTKAPSHWHYTASDTQTSNVDTMKSIAEFRIEEDGDVIRIAIHNFPTKNLKERIPPTAQVFRWKEQFEELDNSNVEVVPQSFAGFAGLRFDGEGVLDGDKKRVIGWAMQLGQEHHLSLEVEHEELDDTLRQQMRSDFTIKAVGPSPLIETHREAIIRFAQSFELIHEIPTMQ